MPSLALKSHLDLLAGDPRYRHYARIPERICRCVEQFQVEFDEELVRAKLRCFYLFIGVVDDAIDACAPEIGEDVLRLLKSRRSQMGDEPLASPAALVTFALKREIPPPIYPRTVRRLEALYKAVMCERRAETLREYVGFRKKVGWRTADLTYRLIEPLLSRPEKRLRRFLQRVGSVGCLVDSLIDLDTDYRNGLLAFRPTGWDRIKLFGRMMRDGLPIVWAYPRAAGLFLAAVRDNFRDRQRRPE